MEEVQYRVRYGKLTGDWYDTEELAMQYLHADPDFVELDYINLDNILIETLPIKTRKVINLTKRDIHILEEGNGRIVRTYPRTINTVKLKESTSIEERLHDGTIIVKTVFGEPENLPQYKEDTYYIVSQLLKSTLPYRKDLLVPADVVYNEDGDMIGCYTLSR